jgi:hypothetical protein
MAFITREDNQKLIVDLSESTVANIVSNFSDHEKRYDSIIHRCFTQHDNEADLLAIRPSGYCDEFEIKLSRSDLLADKNKVVQYREKDITTGIDNEWFTSPKESRPTLAPYNKQKLDALADGDMSVNYFWYVLKVGIGTISDIPEYAGLIIIDNYGSIEVIRHPKKLSNKKLSHEQRFNFTKLLSKRFWTLNNNLKIAKLTGE